MGKNRKPGRGSKPHGMNYAQVLARQAAIRAGLEKAARDATVQAEADAHIHGQHINLLDDAHGRHRMVAVIGGQAVAVGDGALVEPCRAPKESDEVATHKTCAEER